MTTQIELQRARQIVEHNKTFILDAISHRYAELFKLFSDYDFVYHKGTEEEEQELSTAINYQAVDQAKKISNKIFIVSY